MEDSLKLGFKEILGLMLLDKVRYVISLLPSSKLQIWKMCQLVRKLKGVPFSLHMQRRAKMKISTPQ